MIGESVNWTAYLLELRRRGGFGVMDYSSKRAAAREFLAKVNGCANHAGNGARRLFEELLEEFGELNRLDKQAAHRV